MRTRGMTQVRTFIDWDTARRIVKPTIKRSGQTQSLTSMLELQEFISELLQEADKTANYRITYRIYHGWHRGKTKTPDLIAFEKLSAESSLSRRIGTCSFAPEVVFGNNLLCGGKRSILFDTLRRREEADKDEQKMVDTALVSDLLTSVRQERDAIYLVIGDDDDLLPGVITAERWGANIMLARITRPSDNSHLHTADLIRRRKTLQ